jgi:hypothetical protein
LLETAEEPFVKALEETPVKTVWSARLRVKESMLLVAGGTVVSVRAAVLTAMDSTAIDEALNVMRRNPNCVSL